MTAIADQHPQRTLAIDLAWVASGTVWLTSHLVERRLRKQAEALAAAAEAVERVAPTDGALR